MFGYYNSVKSYLDSSYHPVESAMTNGDDLVHLLVCLGASVNTMPKGIAQSYQDNKISLKVWIDDQIYKLDTRIKSIAKPPAASIASESITTPPEYSGWQKYYREYKESLKSPEEEEQNRQVNEKKERGRLEELEKLEDAKAYFVEVKLLFEKHGAENFGKISTNGTRPLLGVNEESNTYKFLSNGYHSRDVPQHLSSSYDQLYEACYVGDHEKIQSLCLPAEDTQPGSILLNISVKMFDDYNGKRLPQPH